MYIVIMTTITSSAASPQAELYALIREVRRLFHRLANATDRLHRGLKVKTAQRAILEELVEREERSVPELARAKGVTRQHVQVVANELLSAGLIEARVNPAHQRSQLLAPTSAGRQLFEAMRSREERLLQAVVERLPARRLSPLAATLRQIGDAVDESLARWADERTTGGPAPRADRGARRRGR
jgi:DNA-binding MarR family transcriptional regulator